MKPNQTMTYFIIKGLSDDPELQAPIFVLVLTVYLTSLVGNMSLILLVCLDSKLHSPMYFFLANLAIVDIGAATVTLYKIFVMFITGDNSMLYVPCVLQSYMFGAFLGQELFILTAMSYDRYVTICRPLNYTIIMNLRICLQLATFCWILGFLHYIPFTWLIFKISCFSTNVIDHFCWDIIPFLDNACSDITFLANWSNIDGTIVYIVILFLLILTSYVYIIRSIMKIRSNTGRRKAFYTCSSQLTVIVLYYTTVIIHYLIPENILGYKKLYSLVNMAFVPMLNPFIYSLKNKDVIAALRRRIGKCTVNTFCCIIKGSVTGIRKKY